jgi:hypothetical protein
MRLPLLSSGQSSWLQVQRCGFDSWRYQIFWKAVGLERGPLSLVSTTEELLRRSNGSSLEIWDYGSRVSPLWPRDTPSIRKVGTNTADKRWSLIIIIIIIIIIINSSVLIVILWFIIFIFINTLFSLTFLLLTLLILLPVLTLELASGLLSFAQK